MLSNIDESLEKYVKEEMEYRDITVTSLASEVYNLQKKFSPEITVEKCVDVINKILKRRDILQLMSVSFQLDNSANKLSLDSPLQEIVENDRGEFGVDELIAMAMCVEYGPIAITTFGKEDTNKHGDAKRLDAIQKNGGAIATFSDDICSALIACGAAKIAHDEENKRQETVSE